jgi:hypothetical protein
LLERRKEMNEALATSQLDTNQAPPLVNAGAVVGGTAIGLGLAVIAGTLWTSEAFTGTHRIFDVSSVARTE